MQGNHERDQPHTGDRFQNTGTDSGQLLLHPVSMTLPHEVLQFCTAVQLRLKLHASRLSFSTFYLLEAQSAACPRGQGVH